MQRSASHRYLRGLGVEGLEDRAMLTAFIVDTIVDDRSAGAEVTDRMGERLRFNNAHPQVNGVVAAGPALHRQLQDKLAKWPA